MTSLVSENMRDQVEIALQDSLSELTKYNQFILYKMIPDPNKPGKYKKLPACCLTGITANAHDPKIWMSYKIALEELRKRDTSFGIGFVLTENDPFWCLDIDSCLENCDVSGKKWSDLAMSLLGMFPDAAVEVSLSKTGLHVFGIGKASSHKCKNTKLNIEFYTSNRFIALTGDRACGSISRDWTEELKQLVSNYFSPDLSVDNQLPEWTDIPCEDWEGYTDDVELINHALKSNSARAAFNKGATFRDIWEANEDVLSRYYSSDNINNYDASSVDMALAMHLAFWTGNDCERIFVLMWQSGLVRDKWDRKDYLSRTILSACAKQKNVFKIQKSKESSGSNQNVSSPESLPTLPEVMPFDFNYLPKVLREYVADISERMQCPPDFPAIGVITMVAGIIGRKIGIRPKCKDDWTIIPNVWGAIVGSSGIKKTPALNATLKPIHKLQAQAFQIYENEKIEYDTEVEARKVTKSVRKAKARKSLQENLSADVKDLLKNTQIGSPPIMKRYIINNATYEKLGEILYENPIGVMVEYDEIIGLLKQLEANGQEVARSFYLSGANGDTPCTFDRIARGTLHIPAVCLSIIGGIQPGVLAEYVRQAISGGSGADGLLQRFGLLVYPDISPQCHYIDRKPDSVARASLNKLVDYLDTFEPILLRAQYDDFTPVPYLHFDDDAQVLYAKWSTELDIRLRSGEEHPAIVSHLAKYHKLIPSLALIYHLCEEQSGPVKKVSLQRAINISKYLESHARRVYSYATRPEVDAAKTILKRLERGKLACAFKARDVSQRGWAGLETPAKAQTAIDFLVEYRHLLVEDLETGGRPTKLYHWQK